MVDAWYGILMRYHEADPGLTNMCLQVICSYIGLRHRIRLARSANRPCSIVRPCRPRTHAQF